MNSRSSATDVPIFWPSHFFRCLFSSALISKFVREPRVVLIMSNKWSTAGWIARPSSICSSTSKVQFHDDVIKWKHYPRNWPFVRGIHRSPVNSPHKGQWRGALMFSLICVWIKDWVKIVRLVIWDAIAPIMQCELIKNSTCCFENVWFTCEFLLCQYVYPSIQNVWNDIPSIRTQQRVTMLYNFPQYYLAWRL